MYIEPQYQLPQQAESLHSNWEHFGEQLIHTVTMMMQDLGQALAPAMQSLANIGQIMAEAVEDGMRNNAYHPTGPVVRSTATILSDEDPFSLPSGEK